MDSLSYPSLYSASIDFTWGLDIKRPPKWKNKSICIGRHIQNTTAYHPMKTSLLSLVTQQTTIRCLPKFSRDYLVLDTLSGNLLRRYHNTAKCYFVSRSLITTICTPKNIGFIIHSHHVVDMWAPSIWTLMLHTYDFKFYGIFRHW